MSKQRLILSSFLAALVLALAGCNTADPGAYTDKRIKRAKLLNEIRADKDTAKANNDAIDKSVDMATINSVKADMKRDCSASDIDKLVKKESCYVEKLDDIKAKNAHSNEKPELFKLCYKEFKMSDLRCAKAVKPLEDKLDAHVKSR